MTVRHEERNGVPVVLLDRPATRNALDMATIEAIGRAIETSAGPVIVLGSSNPAAFSSGADLTLADTERARLSDGLYELYLLMRSTSKVVIAAASGHAVGGGAQLLIASDIRFVSPDLSIRFVGAGHGLVVGAWGLPSLVGRGRAMDLCLTMRAIDAAEAKAIGLVDRVVADPLQAAVEEAALILRLHHGAVARIKEVVSTSDPMEALHLERRQNSTWGGSMSSDAAET